MGFIWTILGAMGRVWLTTLSSPAFICIYVLLVVLVISQYRRLQNLSEALLQGRRNIFLGAALISTGLGLLGGLAGSLLLVLLGVNLAGIPILQLWLAAVFLMLIQPRFLCFAYAAGVLSVSNLLFGYPSVNIPQLMGLVAVLHLVECALIRVNGPLCPFPVYLKKLDQVRGGFNLQLFWPIPLAALLGVSAGVPNISLAAPHWWPLLQSYSQFTAHQNYALIPVLAILGYGEVSTVQTPRQAARRSSLYLAMFSLTLLCLAVLAAHYALFLPLAALFSPLGHELVIWQGRRLEDQAAPLYVPPARGVMVLDILPGTPAHACGLRSQDVVLAVNGSQVDNYHALQNQLNRGLEELVVDIQRGEELFTLHVPVTPNQDLGIIPVPEPDARRYLLFREDRLFRWAGRWRRRSKS